MTMCRIIRVTTIHLKGTLELLAKKLFGADREIRLRPSYFPFTEPSVDLANNSKVPFKSLILTFLSTTNPSICVN
jgi:phenylalanyl-tRNA synthetase alpha subunit